MADVTVKVLDAATSFDFLTLAEVKILLGISASDTSQDPLLSMLITTYSTYVAELCNRTFAKERVTETWREVYDGRVFLTHWPVKESDIEDVVPGGDPSFYPAGVYELEEQSGKLSNVALYEAESTAWRQSVIVTYTGGFVLPDEAPLPLKQAVAILIREERMRNQQAQAAGIRQITHKESRIVFFDPNAIIAKLASSGGRSAGLQAAENLLKQYTRWWV
jgi:hypothetical protein